jgi:hypothetical protein
MNAIEFQAEFATNVGKPSGGASAVVSDYLTTRRQTLADANRLGVGTAGLGEIRSNLATSFIRRWMMTRYATVDLSFTERKWWLRVERDDDNECRIVTAYESEPKNDTDGERSMIGTIPRFFSVHADALEFATGDTQLSPRRDHSLGTLARYRAGRKVVREVRVRIAANVPDGITATHRRKTAEALGFYLFGKAVLLTRGVDLHNEIESAKDSYHRRRDEGGAQVVVIWAPLAEHLSIKSDPVRPKGDPAIVLQIDGHDFLLDFFDTPNERPIEHLIREFSEGSISELS